MSDDEDLEFYPKKVFDVGEVTEDDVDLKSPPTTGIQYLKQVRMELSKCPEIVKADIDQIKFSHRQTVKYSTVSDLKPAPPGFGPTPEWQRKQIADFSALRYELYSKKSSLQKKLPKKEVPKISDIHAWCGFCLGPHYASRFKEIASSEASSSENASTSTGKVDVAGEPNGNLPLLSVVLCLIQPDVEVVLSYHIQWLKVFGFSDHQGRWIHALLSCLEKPLTPNACDLLRKLACTCADLRLSLKSKHDKSLMPLNLIICLVANYFDQKDLADGSSDNDEDEGDSSTSETDSDDLDDDDEEEDDDDDDDDDGE